MQFSTFKDILRALDYILLNFAVPIGFYVTFHLHGSKAAIGFAVAITFIQVIYHLVSRRPFSPFFVIGAVFTAGFGGIDLLIENPHFYRLEPFFQNLIMAVLFIWTMYTEKPLLIRFADALPKALQPEIHKIPTDYLRRLSWLWIVYLFFKSIVFLYLAFAVDLGKLIVLRPIVGGGTLLVMVAGEMIYRQWFYHPPKSELLDS